MITLDKKDGFTASGKIGLKETAVAFFSTPRNCESEQQSEEQNELS